MALRSMTGFGAASMERDGVAVRVELSSVNRKQLDVNVQLPRNLAALDVRVQGLVREQFSRGRISGSIRVEFSGEAMGEIAIDPTLAEGYVTALRKEAERLNISGDLTPSDLVRLPGLLKQSEPALELDVIGGVVEEALGVALTDMAQMRRREGAALATDLKSRFEGLTHLREELLGWAPDVVKTYREKLLNRLEEAGIEGLAEDERVVREVALFADRSDITEELTRLESHLDQVSELLESEEPVGRTLDFLCQELFREINTTGAKANSIEITRCVVSFKSELERIREQVQNVE